ncbi:MFS transporter [Frankia gtarii]|uniref:MFS transporter n=1 Tax=Frankia gtarii TaxID=2950102 RepID=UPI0021C17DF3|nr:MFS transporter [Frankia gtarii]
MTSLDEHELTTQPARSTKAQWWILVIIACAQLMVVLDSTIMIIALPSAQRALGFSDAARQWVITAYTLAFGGFLLVGGRISDMLGPRRTLMAGVIGFALASALGGAAPNTAMLIAARGLQGLSGALLAPSVLSLLTATFPSPRERGRAFGIYATIAIGGSAFGLILGGFLTQYADWRWCLYVNLPIAALVIFGVVAMIPKSTGRPGVRLDIAGVVLGCGGLVALVYGLGEAGADGWGSRGVLIPLALAAVLLACFVVWQSRGSNPLLPLRVLRDRNRSGAYLTILLAMTAMFGTFVSLTFLFQSVDHYSPLRTGIAFLPLMVLNGLASTQLASRLMPYVPTRLLIVPGLLFAAVGIALLTRLTPDAAFATRVLPTEILLGVGLGVAMVPAISTATSNADPNDVGVTSAMSTTSQQIGASIGTALLNTIAASAATSYLASHRGGDAIHATVHGYATASAWGAGILALAALTAGLLINVHPGRAHPSDAARGAGGHGGELAAQPSQVTPLVPAAQGE